MKTILLPTDFSTAALDAATYAAGLSRETGAKLILFHAYLLPVAVSEVPFVMITGEEMQKNSEASLKKEAERIKGIAGLEPEQVSRMGIVLDEMKDLIKERSIDLVIMGSREKEGLDRLLGSTANAAINSLKKPILIIPVASQYTGFKSITYASDFHFQDSLECFEVLLFLVRKFNSRLSVVHVIKEGKSLTGEQQAGKSRLEAILGNVEHEYGMVEYNDFEKGIVQYLQHEKSDLLVVVAREHNFFDRMLGHHTSQDLSVKTHLPLLILHDKS